MPFLSKSFFFSILPVKKNAQEDALTNNPLSNPVCFFQSVDENLSSNRRSVVFLSGILKRASAKHNNIVPSREY